MGFFFKPLKLILFILVIFGVLNLELKGKKIMTHLSDWISAQKTKDKAEKWAKEKAENLLETAKDKVSEDLQKIEDKAEEIQAALPKKEELIPGTAIPKSLAENEREAKIIQKLNVENELISGDDKGELKGLLE